MKPLEQWLNTIRGWAKRAADVTFQEGKILSIRAMEAGKLTALNAQKHKITKEFQEICAQLGHAFLELDERGQNDVLAQPKVQELIEKAHHLELEERELAKDIESCKKESNDEVKTIYKKAA